MTNQQHELITQAAHLVIELENRDEEILTLCCALVPRPSDTAKLRRIMRILKKARARLARRENAFDKAPLPFVDEIVERLEDVGFMVKVLYPYVIVLNFKNRQITSMEVAEALDIEPEFCARSVSGDIRITCD